MKKAKIEFTKDELSVMYYALSTLRVTKSNIELINCITAAYNKLGTALQKMLTKEEKAELVQIQKEARKRAMKAQRKIIPID